MLVNVIDQVSDVAVLDVGCWMLLLLVLVEEEDLLLLLVLLFVVVLRLMSQEHRFD